MPRGYVYILINATMPGLLKIGQTSRTPEERARELSQETGVPVPYVVAYEEALAYYEEAEREIHKRLSRYRLSRNREFFSLSVKDAIQVVRQVARECRKREEEERQRLEEERRKQEEAEPRKQLEEGKAEGRLSDSRQLGDEEGPESDYLSDPDGGRHWLKSPAMFATIFACLLAALIVCFCLCSGLAGESKATVKGKRSSVRLVAASRAI